MAGAGKAAWAWREFGARLMLVTDGGGAQVILAPSRRRGAHSDDIETRDPVSGILRPIKADDDVARLIAAAPDMLAALQSAVESLEQLVSLNRIPAENKGLREARAAIAKAKGAV